MISCVKRFLFAGAAGVFLYFSAKAEEPENLYIEKTDDVENIVTRTSPDSLVLMAGSIDVKSNLSSKIDSLLLQKELEEEELLYPADDLYGMWTNERVNPYANKVEIPDSFSIDVSSFVCPVEGRVTSKFGPRSRVRFHYGIDLKLQTGDTVRAAFDGKIRIKSFDRRGYGYYLVVRHNNGLETVYGHLSKFLVDTDEIVKAGEPIALGGNTGRSTGAHLHFETRFLGQAINPSDIIDFENFVAHEDMYVFNKAKAGAVNKYTGTGTDKIVYHRIKSGDTLSKIAKRYGISVNTLCKLNNIKPTTTLKIGRTLRCS